MPENNEPLEFCGEIKDISTRACLVTVDGVTGWIPDSMTDYIDEPELGKEIRFTIPTWIAESKGFIE